MTDTTPIPAEPPLFAGPKVNRALFVATIFAGSFLLFLVQPLVARLALPRLGGSPNVWNSAMLVYQALLLAGYGYAHWLSKLPVRRQALLHLALLVLAAISLPIALADLPPPRPGLELLWVPALLALTIGPVFFLVSAQAPMMQRWYAAGPVARAPWALYAASNLGSFGGLLAYPLLVEPQLPSGAQSWGWTAGYSLLAVLVAACAWSRWNAAEPAPTATVETGEKIGARRIAMWLVLSAVPSGLMLSTTTHLTTDLFAMPLLWVIPLGLYLLSFTLAFADHRGAARAIYQIAPFFILLTGGYAAATEHAGTLAPVLASIALLFVVCVALHGRLYDLRPESTQLTLFYLAMSAGGVLGGAFTALVAPLVFNWVWEHPILVLAAAAILPRASLFDWRGKSGIEPIQAQISGAMILVVALGLCWLLYEETTNGEPPGLKQYLLTGGIAGLGAAIAGWRWTLPVLLAALMYAQGGWDTVDAEMMDKRSRSYFGVYTVRDYPESGIRTLAHGTTLHGKQSLDPRLRRMPISYYGPGSAAGIAFANTSKLFGPNARIGVVGLGAGTLACFHQPGQTWHFFEIDETVLNYSRNGTFTYLSDCAPDARVVMGDARLKLATMPKSSFDLIALDAFSSDSVPLHLMTGEAMGMYLERLSPKGLLLVHISNRYIDLEPVVAAMVKQRGLAALALESEPQGNLRNLYTSSVWIAVTREPKQIDMLGKLTPGIVWRPLGPPAARVWSDDHASILPHVRWRNLLGN